MSKGPESTLVDNIKKAIIDTYPAAWVQKIHGGFYQTNSIPDILCCVYGQLFAFEVKYRRPGESFDAMMKRVTPGQLTYLDELRASGAIAQVIWRVDQALSYIHDWVVQ